jgi:hypothetical protein
MAAAMAATPVTTAQAAITISRASALRPGQSRVITPAATPAMPWKIRAPHFRHRLLTGSALKGAIERENRVHTVLVLDRGGSYFPGQGR